MKWTHERLERLTKDLHDYCIKHSYIEPNEQTVLIYGSNLYGISYGIYIRKQGRTGLSKHPLMPFSDISTSKAETGKTLCTIMHTLYRIEDLQEQRETRELEQRTENRTEQSRPKTKQTKTK